MNKSDFLWSKELNSFVIHYLEILKLFKASMQVKTAAISKLVDVKAVHALNHEKK